VLAEDFTGLGRIVHVFGVKGKRVTTERNILCLEFRKLDCLFVDLNFLRLEFDILQLRFEFK
jgi:hypothetical protein